MSSSHPPPPGPFEQPGHYPPPGPYGPPGPWAPGPYPYGPPAPAVPVTMPGSVRGAQVTVFAMMGLCVAMSVLVGIAQDAEAAGANFSLNLPGCVLFVLAFWYGRGGNGMRVTSIVLASVQILFGLSGAAQGIGGGIFALAGAVAIVAQLSQSSAGAWFRRPRGPVAG